MARIGLMGCGSVADFGHLPAIASTPGLELVALFDPNADRVRDMARKFSVPKACTETDDFFDSDLDGIVVCSSATAHHENVLAAAERGLHVLCEKPLAMEDREAEEMIEVMEKAGKMLLTGFVYRFSPVAMQIRDWVREGRIGEVKSLRLIYIWDLHGQWERSDEGDWIESPRWRGRMLEGGPMVDCGVHQIDLARWWLGQEVVNVRGAGAWVSDYVAPDHVYVHMDHSNGAHTMVETSFTYGHTSKEPAPQFSYDLIGTGGVIRYDRNGWRLEFRDGSQSVVAPGASEKNFLGMHHEFARALATGKPGDLPTGRDGLIATRIARLATDEIIATRPTSG